MELSKNRLVCSYVDFITLGSIPLKTLKYRLDKRSALEWFIGHYRVGSHKRVGITSQLKRLDNCEYTVCLLSHVITVIFKIMKDGEGLLLVLACFSHVKS